MKGESTGPSLRRGAACFDYYDYHTGIAFFILSIGSDKTLGVRHPHERIWLEMT